MRKHVAALFALGLALGGSAQGQDLSPDAARSFIDRLGERTVTVLKSTAPDRTMQLGRILLDGMDFDTVSMHTLGRYGRKPDGRDFEEFSLLFSAYIIDLAIERFGNLPIRGYEIASSNKLPNGDVLVNTTVARDGGDPLRAGWRVREFARGPLIIDIEVDGYSMTTHFRGQWQDWLSKAGLEGMVEKLRGMTRNSPSVALARTHRRG